MNEFVIKNQPMSCASADAESRKYHMIQKGHETWLYTDQPDASSQIYYHNKASNNKDGFAGRIITFPLVDGTEIKLKAPWHTGSDALYKNTGVDLRNKHLQQVVIASSMEYREFPGKWGMIKLPVLKGIFHIDKEPIIGPSNRGNDIAKGIANSIGRNVRCYIHTTGVSCLGVEKPDKER